MGQNRPRKGREDSMRGPAGPAIPPTWDPWSREDGVSPLDRPEDEAAPPESDMPHEGAVPHGGDVGIWSVNVDKPDDVGAIHRELDGSPANVGTERPTLESQVDNVGTERLTSPTGDVGIEDIQHAKTISWWMDLRQEDPDIRDAIGILLKGRETLALHPPSRTSPNTARKYAMWNRRMEEEGVGPDEMAPRYAKTTAYVIRAAFIDECLSRRLPDGLKAGRNAIQDMDPEALVEAAVTVRDALGRLERYPPDKQGERIRRKAADPTSVESFYAAARRRAVELHGPELELARANPNLSRRTILSRLPDGWRDSFWAAVRDSSLPDHAKAPFAIFRLLGCRPQEVEDGILVEAAGNKLSLTVLYPAKSHHEKYGLGTRTHTMRIIGTQARWLADYAMSHGGRIKIAVPRKRLLKTARAVSGRAFPGIHPPVVPYDFRHQFSADVKAHAAGLFPDSPSKRAEYVAERMGHSSCKSQRAYGTSKQAGGLGGVDIGTVTIKDPSRKVNLRHGGNRLSAFKTGGITPSV